MITTAEMKLTRSQERMIGRLIETIAGRVGERREIKSITVKRSESTPLAFLEIEIGRRVVAETMIEFMLRERRHICIGPRGGLELLNSYRKDRRHARGFLHATKAPTTR
jgi:hypothetical protein